MRCRVRYWSEHSRSSPWTSWRRNCWLPEQGATVPLPVLDLAANGKNILGSCMGSTRLSNDVPWLVNLYRQGRLKLDELITARYPLEQINEAIESMEKGEALRNVIIFR